MRIVRKHRNPAEAGGDMTPMIDMSFQLIAFFMVLINFSDIAQDEKINLPAAELAKPPDAPYAEPLAIQLRSDDRVFFAGDDLTMNELQVALMREAQIIRATPGKSVSDVTIIIRADRLAKTGLVQEIIEMCQKAQFDTFALRGRQTDESLYDVPEGGS